VPQSIGQPHTVVLADQLSRDAILDGIRRGRSWIAESADVSVGHTASSGTLRATFGERLAVAGDVPVTITATVFGVPNGTVRFITDEGQSQQIVLPTGRIGNSSFDEKAGTLNNLFAFSDSAGRAGSAVNKLFLDPGTGQPSKS
jgi:hypothetical protein